MDVTGDGTCASAEPGGLEPLIIIEEGDDIDRIICNIEKDNCQESVTVAEENNGDDRGVRENRNTTDQDQQETNASKSEDRTVQQTDGHEEERGGGGTEERRQKTETEMKDTEAGVDVKGETGAMAGTDQDAADMADSVGEEGASHPVPPPEEPDRAEGRNTEVTNTEVVLRHKTQPNSDMSVKSKDFLSPEDAQRKVNRLSSDFPDALYEFLHKVQEGRRLNDQRCSFRLEARRRCYSEPSTPRHSSSKVMFSSMTSLQREEFFELVATSQARRLDDQRANAESIQPLRAKPQASPPQTSPPQPPRPSDRKLSVKASLKKAAPAPRPKEELYNMILTSQAQGRIEEQRSRAPGPMDDEDFFSLLLKVQGGRMDEQRTELPVTARD